MMLKKILVATALLTLSLTSITVFAQEIEHDGVNLYLIRHGKTMFNTTGQVEG